MNKQDKDNGQRGIEWTNYTWNPVGGCLHGCRWQMPDGTVAVCYAEDVANGIAQAAYPQGFEHHYWHPERLSEPKSVKTPSRIFLDSMADLMGHWVSDDQIKKVLDACDSAYWHDFQLLTKNAPRLLKFKFPKNVWVGVSSPPDWFMKKRLGYYQQIRMLQRTLDVLREIEATVRWMSLEPLSWDVAEFLDNHPLQWVVIGAASKGRVYFQPNDNHVERVLKIMDDTKTPVFFKGNLDWNPRREEFPQ